MGEVWMPDGNKIEDVFSIFSRGCKHYKSIHVNSAAKIAIFSFSAYCAMLFYT